MLKFQQSYLSNFQLPWLKSPNVSFQFLCHLLKSGIYLHKEQWHGFHVFIDKETITFTLFCLQYAVFNLHVYKFSQESEISFLSVTDFIMEFIEQYTFYEQNLSVYHSNELDDIFLNHSTYTLLWDYEQLQFSEENKFIISSNEKNFEICVDRFHVATVNEYNNNGAIIHGNCNIKLEPNTLETYLMDAGKIKEYESVYKLSFQMYENGSIKVKKQSSLWYRNQNYILTTTSSPKIHEMLKLKKPYSIT